MKDRAEVERVASSFFARHRLAYAAGAQDPWPERIALGSPTKAELASRPHELARVIDELTIWAAKAPVTLEYASRRVGGGMHDIPSHAIIASADDAAALCGRAAVADLARARSRCKLLAGSFDLDAATLFRILKATDGWSEVDFTLMTSAACWFVGNDETGMTSREVPLAGFSSKWLDKAGRRSAIELVIGRPLAFAPRLRSIDFAYLDPAYLKRGGRRFDSYTEGDASILPYAPTIAFIVENRDTFLAFPEVEGGVCIFGSGWAGTSIAASIPWISEIDNLFYWGDIDADGFEILDGYRCSGLDARSLFMDMQAYELFEPFGTNEATGKTPLESRVEKPLACLTEEERKVYHLITSPDCPGHRRIEQERIPLSELSSRVEKLFQRD